MRKVVLVIIIVVLAQGVWSINNAKFGLVFNPFNDQQKEYFGGICKLNNKMIEITAGYLNVSHDGESLGSSYNITAKFGLITSLKQIDINYGLGYSTSIIADDDESYSDNIIKLFTGVEKVMFNNLSIGGEIDLNYIIADKSYSPLGYANDCETIKTGTSVFIRFYFGE